MAIVIPEAQTPFDPVEQPRVNPNAPNIGDGLSGLADAGIRVVAGRQKAEADRQLREARLTALERMDAARLKYETDGNLDGLTDRWQAESGAIADEVAAGLPKHLQKDFALSMRETIAPQTSAIRRREYSLFQDRERASLNGDLRRFDATAAKAPDRAAGDAIQLERAAAIGAAVDAGLISAVDGDAMIADGPRIAERIAALTMVDEDPAGFLEARKAGEFDNLDPEEGARWELAAKAGVQAEAARVQKEADIAAVAADKALGARVDAAITLLDDGLQVKGLADLQAEAAGTPHGDRLQASLDMPGVANFALMTPAEQAAELAAERKRLHGNPSDVGRINRLEAIADRTRESLADDALAHVRARGIAEVPPVDLSDPASVAARVALAEAVTREYTPEATEMRYFDKAEAARFRAILEGPDPDQALALVDAIDRTFPDGARAAAALAQIGGSDPAVQVAAALPGATGEVTAARAILQGRILQKKDGGAALSDVTRRTVQAEFAGVFNDPDRLEAALKAADAHYAATAGGIADPKSPEAVAAYRASVQAVTAQTQRGSQTLGGIQPVHGRPSLLPADLDAATVELAIVNFHGDAWQRASQTGNLPMWGQKTSILDVDADARADLTILSLRDGSYALGALQGDGSIRYLRDPGQTDGVFRFDLHTFVKGVPAP